MERRERRVLVEVAPPVSPLQAFAPRQVVQRVALAAGVEPDAAWGTMRSAAVTESPSLLSAPRVALARALGHRSHDEFLVRAAVPAGEEGERIVGQIAATGAVRGVHADPRVALAVRCEDHAAVGDEAAVAQALAVDDLHARAGDGTGVRVALVDSGVSLEFLNERGRSHTLDEELSWIRPGASQAAGSAPTPVDDIAAHGTIAAFATGIAAPGTRLVDLAAFASVTEAADDSAGDEPLMQTWLGDIDRALSRIRLHLEQAPADRRPPIVISNSWALVDPSWDFPPGHPANFSDNPEHRFNKLLDELVDLGADVVFAAGNLGAECRPDQPLGDTPICGANSLAGSVTVGAVAVDRERLGYSSSGPGRLEFEKPDLCGYSHFEGTKLTHADWGTSVACPLVAGVIAALRTRVSPTDVPPRELAAVLRETADRAEGQAHDPDYGWGIVNPSAALAKLGL